MNNYNHKTIKENKSYTPTEHIPMFDKYLQPNELLKQIDGYGGRYYISNYGNVYSKWVRRKLRYNINNSGYQSVRLCYKQQVDTVKVSILTALYWCENDDPQEKTIVHHMDCNKLNNKASNLQWVSFPEHLALHNCRQRKKTL